MFAARDEASSTTTLSHCLQTVDMAPEVAQDAIDIITQGVEKFGKTQDYEVRPTIIRPCHWLQAAYPPCLTEDVPIREGGVRQEVRTHMALLHWRRLFIRRDQPAKAQSIHDVCRVPWHHVVEVLKSNNTLAQPTIATAIATVIATATLLLTCSLRLGFPCLSSLYLVSNIAQSTMQVT